MNAGRVSALAVDSRRGFGIQVFVCWYPHIIRGGFSVVRKSSGLFCLRIAFLCSMRFLLAATSGFSATCSLISWSWVFLGLWEPISLHLCRWPGNRFSLSQIPQACPPFHISTTRKINELTTTFSPKATIETNDLIGILYLMHRWESCVLIPIATRMAIT